MTNDDFNSLKTSKKEAKMFTPGHKIGRPKGVKNRKKVIKVADFVAANDINIPKLWLEAIMQIVNPTDKAKSLAEYNKWCAAMPVAEVDEAEEFVEPATADVLTIIR